MDFAQIKMQLQPEFTVIKYDAIRQINVVGIQFQLGLPPGKCLDLQAVVLSEGVGAFGVGILTVEGGWPHFQTYHSIAEYPRQELGTQLPVALFTTEAQGAALKEELTLLLGDTQGGQP